MSSSNQAIAQSESTGSLWLNLGAGSSDNIRRVAVQPESGSFAIVGIESDYQYERSRLDLEFEADLERRQYSVSNLEDETYGTATLDAVFSAVPERLFWLVSDDYSQGRIDPFDVTSPDNRAEINVFTTGPRFVAGIGGRSQVQLEALRSKRSVSDFEGLDSDADEYSAAYVRFAGSTTEVAVRVSSRNIDYRSTDTEFDIETAYLSYRKQLSTGEAYLAVGSTRTSSLDSSSSTPYVSLGWARDVGARSRVEIDAVRQYADFFDDFLFGRSTETVLGREIYRQQLVSLTYAVEGVRNSLSLSFSVDDADYAEQESLNFSENEVSADFRRALSPRLTLGVGYSLAERDYEFGQRVDSSEVWIASLERSLGSRLAVAMSYESREDESVLGDEIGENMIRVVLRYLLAGGAD